MAYPLDSDTDPNLTLIMGIEFPAGATTSAIDWRRHTQVYGGGVCKACEESEKLIRLMSVKPLETGNKDEHEQMMVEEIMDDDLSGHEAR